MASTDERICTVDRCTNLGESLGIGRPRRPICGKHARERWPALAASARACKRKRYANGKQAAGFAAQLLRGDRIRHRSNHHRGHISDATAEGIAESIGINIVQWRAGELSVADVLPLCHQTATDKRIGHPDFPLVEGEFDAQR
jgi:hypothetical protein